jgi:hypothetical protein
MKIVALAERELVEICNVFEGLGTGDILCRMRNGIPFKVKEGSV